MSVPNAARDAAHGGTVTHPVYSIPHHLPIALMPSASTAAYVSPGDALSSLPALAPIPIQQPFVPLPRSPPIVEIPPLPSSAPSLSTACADAGVGANLGAQRATKHKINISYIDDNRKRQVSFCKRKNGAMKKGMELNLMTGSMIGIFVFNPANGWYHEFGTHDPVEILRAYASFTGPSERRRDADFFDEYEAAMARAEEAEDENHPIDSNPARPLTSNNPMDDLAFFHVSPSSNDHELPNPSPPQSPPHNVPDDKLVEDVPVASNSGPHPFPIHTDLPQNDTMSTTTPVSASIEALLSPGIESSVLVGHPNDHTMSPMEVPQVPPSPEDIPTAASVPALEDEIGWSNALTERPLENLPWNPTSYYDQIESLSTNRKTGKYPQASTPVTFNLHDHLCTGTNSQPSLYYSAYEFETHHHLHGQMQMQNRQHKDQKMCVDHDNANNNQYNIVGKKRLAPQCVENNAKVRRIT